MSDQGNGNREVKSRSLFFQIGWGQVHGREAAIHSKAATGNRSCHTFPAFFH